MQTYADMTKEQLQEELTKVRQIYKEYQDKGLKLDMSVVNHPAGSWIWAWGCSMQWMQSL